MTVRPFVGMLVLAAAVLLGTGRTSAVQGPPSDPLLPFSTILGEGGWGSFGRVAIAPDGSLWVAVRTEAGVFMGVPRPRAVPWEREVVVLRLHPEDHRVLSLLWLGGDAFPAAFAFDSAGNAFLVGSEVYGEFPASASFGVGGGGDGIVVKIRSNGSSILWSGRLGGSDNDHIGAVAVVDGGDLVVSGTTESADFPVARQFQAGRNGTSDGFLTRLRGDGSGIAFSTYFGGVGGDGLGSIVVLPDGALLVAGTSDSPEFAGRPVLFGGPWGGYGGSFIAEFDPTGAILRRVALVTDTGTWGGFGVLADGPDRFLLWGTTAAPDFPSSTPPSSTSVAFLLRLATTDWSVLGGSLNGGIRPYVAAHGPNGTVWMVGEPDGPGGVLGAARPFPGGGQDVLAAAFSGEDLSQVYGTYLGGEYSEGVNGVAVAADGSAWVLGTTQSPDFPLVAPLPIVPQGDDSAFTPYFLSQLLSGDPEGRPAAPGRLTADALDDGTVRLSWEDNSTNETGFAIYRHGYDSLSPYWLDSDRIDRIAVVPGGTGAWVDEGVSSNRNYGWSVQAISNAGGSDPSAAAVIELPPTLSVSIERGSYKPAYSAAGLKRRTLRLQGRFSTLAPGGRVDPREGGFEWKHSGDSNMSSQWLIPPGDQGWRPEGRRFRWKGEALTLTFDPTDGSFDMEVSRWIYPGFGSMQFTVGRHSGTISPQWRVVRRSRIFGYPDPMRIP